MDEARQILPDGAVLWLPEAQQFWQRAPWGSRVLAALRAGLSRAWALVVAVLSAPLPPPGRPPALLALPGALATQQQQQKLRLQRIQMERERIRMRQEELLRQVTPKILLLCSTAFRSVHHF